MASATAVLAGPREIRAATATGIAPRPRSRREHAATAVPALMASSAMAGPRQPGPYESVPEALVRHQDSRALRDTVLTGRLISPARHRAITPPGGTPSHTLRP